MSRDALFDFNNEFDLRDRDLNELVIRETNSKDNCFIHDKIDELKVYGNFLFEKNNSSKLICKIAFYKSSITGKYLPRPTFQRVALNGDIKSTKSGDKVTIAFTDSRKSIIFWKFIGFLYSNKEVIEQGTFKKFQVVNSNFYKEFRSKTEKEKINELQSLVENEEFSEKDLKRIFRKNRVKVLRVFYSLLKNVEIKGDKSLDLYRSKYSIRDGEEYIWHHFLKKNDWILGLNVDIKFVFDWIDEVSTGMPNSQNKGNPKADFLGLSDFTTIVELKHTNSRIFKPNKSSKSRALTWDFHNDIIEGISQASAQKFEFEKHFDSKKIIDLDGKRVDKNQIQNVDPKTILLIGNKQKEFPIFDSIDENTQKNMVFERFRRGLKNVDILSYDELFVRAYHIVYPDKKLSLNWYSLSLEELF